MILVTAKQIDPITTHYENRATGDRADIVQTAHQHWLVHNPLRGEYPATEPYPTRADAISALEHAWSN